MYSINLEINSTYFFLKTNPLPFCLTFPCLVYAITFEQAHLLKPDIPAWASFAHVRDTGPRPPPEYYVALQDGVPVLSGDAGELQKQQQKSGIPGAHGQGSLGGVELRRQEARLGLL